MTKRTIHTIGHSRHTISRFVRLLQRHRIDAVADVRSTPFSRRHPQFNRDSLSAVLRRNGIRYVFLGRELGARSDDPACYLDGQVQYRLLSTTRGFQSGLKRIRQGSTKWRIALMCAERDPLDCHRTILVARHLAEHGVRVAHILADGSVEPHEATMKRLWLQLGMEREDLFDSEEEVAARAYEMQERRIAHTDATIHQRGKGMLK